MPFRAWNPLGASIALASLLLLLNVASAAATTRFATPTGNGGATGAEPCSLRFPCSAKDAIRSAVAGDDVVLEPGTYTGNSTFEPKGGVTVHGLAGVPRPVIDAGRAEPALFLPLNSVVSHIEIDGSESQNLIDVAGGTAEDLIARSSVNGGFACTLFEGTLRDSVCLSSGSGGVAAGSHLSGGSRPPITVQLRNVTAIATGAGSSGLGFSLSGPPFGGVKTSITVNATGVIAKGTAQGVFAAALSEAPHTAGQGADSKVVLDHSDYATFTTETDAGAGTPFVTPPGSGTNITAPALLAADGFHQLPQSPTIDKGAVDPLSGAADIDGQLRTIDSAADIGADEFTGETSTTVTCAPAAVGIGQAATCTATVVDTAESGTPSGSVGFASDGPGALSSAACTLTAAGASKSTCGLTYRPSQVGAGSHKITASYAGDAEHRQSQGSTAVHVNKKTQGGPGGGGSGGKNAPNTKLKKTPRKKTAQRRAGFAFVSDQGGSTFQCKLDKKPFKPCHSPFKATVKPGSHSFQVRAVNDAGVADPTPAIFHWKVGKHRGEH
jgi:hypothetical protein